MCTARTVRSRRDRSLRANFRQVILRAFQRRAHRKLLGIIRAQARPQELVDPLDVRFDRGRVAAHHSPAHSPAGNEIAFREAIESHYRNVRRQGRERNMRLIVENQLVVDFVGKNDKVVLPGEIRNPFQGFA